MTPTERNLKEKRDKYDSSCHKEMPDVSPDRFTPMGYHPMRLGDERQYSVIVRARIPSYHSSFFDDVQAVQRTPASSH